MSSPQTNPRDQSALESTAILRRRASSTARAHPIENADTEPDDGAFVVSLFVVSLTDTLTAALAAASREDLVRFAEPWSKTDELQ